MQRHSVATAEKRVEGCGDEKTEVEADEDEDEDRQVNECEVDLCKTIAWR